MCHTISLALLLFVSGQAAPDSLPPPPPPDLPLPPPPSRDEPVNEPPATPFQNAPKRELAPSVASTQHRFSLTISPLLLLLPIAQVMGEFRVADKFGAAGLVGVGGVLGYLALQLGGQFRYYLLGSFIHGMELGAQVMALVLTGEFGGSSQTAAGLSLAPFVGYKIATNVGFTFDAQVGPDFVLAGATSSLVGSSAASSNGSIGLLLNLNVGWSF